MKTPGFIFLLILFSFNIRAQDSLFLINDESLVVNIESLDDHEIKYSFFDDLEKYINRIEVSRVKKIRYASGNEQFFNTQNTQSYIPQPARYPTEEPDKSDDLFKKKLGLGIQLGTSIAKFDYEMNHESIDKFSDWRYGPAAAIFLEWEMKRYFSLRTSLSFIEKGDRVDGEPYIASLEFPDENRSATGNGYINKYLRYLDFSLMPMYCYTKKDNSFQLQFGAGIYAAYGINGKEKVDLYFYYFENGDPAGNELIDPVNQVEFVNDLADQDKEDDVLYYNSFDAGLTFYLGIKPRPFIIGTSLSLGMANVLATQQEDLFNFDGPEETAKNINIMLSFGYYL